MRKFGLYEDQKSILEEQDIEKDQSNFVSKSLDIGSNTKDDLSEYIPQDRLLASESSSSLRKIRFTEQKFLAGKPVSNIKYHHPSFHNNNLFHLFNN